MFTLVLSTPKPTQFSQGIFKLVKTESIFWKIADAVPHSLPLVGHVSSNCVATCHLFTSNILAVSGFSFSTPVSLDPSTDKLQDPFFMFSIKQSEKEE